MTDFVARPVVGQAIKILFWLAVLMAVYFALEPYADDPLGAMRDKFKHMIAFATLAGLAAFGWRETPLLRIGERLSFLGALIEVFQSIPSLHRDCDPKDWAADTLAIVIVLALVKATGLRDAKAQI